MTQIRKLRPTMGAESSTSTVTHDPSLTATLQLSRRREASRRLASLECGCADPWSHRCDRSSGASMSEKALDGWAQAILTLLAVGSLPLVPRDALRELWRRGGEDRVIAEKLRAAEKAVAS
jgi:hypothetical protein